MSLYRLKICIFFIKTMDFGLTPENKLNLEILEKESLLQGFTNKGVIIFLFELILLTFPSEFER